MRHALLAAVAASWLCAGEVFADPVAVRFPEGSLQEMPTIDPAAERIIGWQLEPGDAVAFHMLALHRSAGSQGRRRVFSVRVLGDDMVHAPRPWTTSPAFPGLAEELGAGMPLDHQLFPLLYHR